MRTQEPEWVIIAILLSMTCFGLLIVLVGSISHRERDYSVRQRIAQQNAIAYENMAKRASNCRVSAQTYTTPITSPEDKKQDEVVNRNTELMNELNLFISAKNIEIDKLNNMKKSAIEIMNSIGDDNALAISHTKLIIEEIDSRITLIESIKSKAELMLQDVDSYEKIEQIRKWLNDN